MLFGKVNCDSESKYLSYSRNACVHCNVYRYNGEMSHTSCSQHMLCIVTVQTLGKPGPF